MLGLLGAACGLWLPLDKWIDFAGVFAEHPAQTQTMADGQRVAWQFFIQKGRSMPSDVCGVLAEAHKQQRMVLFAYQNPQVLQAAEDSSLSWREYSGAVENLVRRVYTVGSIEGFDFARDVGSVVVLFETTAGYDPGEVQILTVLETYSNGTIWGFDPKGKRVLLAGRDGLIRETSQDLIIHAHQQLFGEVAGELL